MIQPVNYYLSGLPVFFHGQDHVNRDTVTVEDRPQFSKLLLNMGTNCGRNFYMPPCIFKHHLSLVTLLGQRASRCRKRLSKRRPGALLNPECSFDRGISPPFCAIILFHPSPEFLPLDRQ